MKWMPVILVTSLIICGSAFGATLSLKAAWTANTESDMKGYRLYRTDGTRTLVGPIPPPTSSYSFSVTGLDQCAGRLTYVLKAVDTNNNESSDSTPATYAYNLNTTPPASHNNLSVQKRTGMMIIREF